MGRNVDRPIHHVVRHLDIDRPLMPQARLHATDDFLGRALLVQQDRGGNGHFVIHPPLRVERLYLVMQQRIFLPILSAWRPADDHHRRFLRVRAGNRIHDVQPADAIGHADQPNAVDPAVRIGGEPGARLVAHRDRLNFRAIEPRERRQREISRHAEAVTNPVAMKIVEQKLAQRHISRKGMPVGGFSGHLNMLLQKL